MLVIQKKKPSLKKLLAPQNHRAPEADKQQISQSRRFQLLSATVVLGIYAFRLDSTLPVRDQTWLYC